MKKYELSHAKLNLDLWNEDIPVLKFNSFKNMAKYSADYMFNEEETDIVYVHFFEKEDKTLGAVKIDHRPERILMHMAAYGEYKTHALHEMGNYKDAKEYLNTILDCYQVQL